MSGLAAALGLAVAAGIDPYLAVAAVGLTRWMGWSSGAPHWTGLGPVVAAAGAMGLLSLLDPPRPGSRRERLEWVLAPAVAVALVGPVAGDGGGTVGTAAVGIAAALIAGGARRLLRRLRGGGPEGLPALLGAAFAILALRAPAAGAILGLTVVGGSWALTGRLTGSTRETLWVLVSPPRRTPDEFAPPGSDAG